MHNLICSFTFFRELIPRDQQVINIVCLEEEEETEVTIFLYVSLPSANTIRYSTAQKVDSFIYR